MMLSSTIPPTMHRSALDIVAQDHVEGRSPGRPAPEIAHTRTGAAAASFRHIRCVVFQATQVEMAAIAGVRQATISRWESDDLTPSLPALRRIRAEARRRGIEWNDAWFFGEDGA